MRFLADENFPAAAVIALQKSGHDVVWIARMSPGITDLEILALAINENRVIVTFDKDFGELARQTTPSPRFGVVFFRMPMRAATDVGAYLAGLLESRSDWEGHFSVIETHRIRMRPLPNT